ncbi:MAG TPA: DUF1501 domain-containing protein [Candidatus Limnocylindrales bacterium]|nr:DUF1501 domain-containing protein [Candidatus Limnocylindrales bacterium]
MALTRRQFLKRSAIAGAGAALGPHMKWLPGTNVSYAAGPADAIVVFVQLYGGNDGLNTVYPLNGTQRTLYNQYRPTLRLPDTAGGLAPFVAEGFNASTILDIGQDAAGTNYALHPSMKAWHDIHLAGELAVVPGVHYPHADYSHFRSEVIYYTGDPIGSTGLGWMGKYMELAGFLPTDVPAVMMGGEYNPLFTPTTTSLLAFRQLGQLRFPAGSLGVEREATFRQLYVESSLSDPASFPELASLGVTGVASIDKFSEYYRSGCSNAGKVEALLVDEDGCYDGNNPLIYSSPLNPEYTPDLTYNRLARDLRHVAAAIRADVGARFFHVAVGGFDSHSSQEQGFYHSYLLHTVAEAVGAFWNEMKQTVSLPGLSGYQAGDLSPKVLVVTLSEFGRTNKQNATSAANAGTDHGRSAPQFVIGAGVQGGIHGEYPTLDDPDLDDDLRMAYDFRDFYGTMLERWLGVSASDIGPGPGKIFAATPEADDLGQSYTAYTPIPYLLP